jgi:VanZ family protein
MFLLAVLGRFCKYWLPLLLWMGVIFGASTHLGAPSNTSYFFRPLMHWLFPNMPEETFEHVHYFVRKTAHFAEYSILGILVWRVVHFDAAFQSISLRRQCWLVVLCCLLYASSDEFHQKFVPTREPAVHDVMIDTCGACCGLLVALGLHKCRGQSTSAPIGTR